MKLKMELFITLLKVLIPVWKAEENSVIISGDTLYIKLGGDERNVERKQNHVMITFCLLNDGDEVFKPNHQFRYIFLYVYYYNFLIIKITINYLVYVFTWVKKNMKHWIKLARYSLCSLPT